LRAFTPRDQKAVKAAAETFRANPGLDVEKAIMELGVGEALVSFLDAKGTPGVVERAFICPPHGQIGPVTPDQRAAIIKGSVVYGHYEKMVDRESAYEKLKARVADPTPAQQAARGDEPIPVPKPRGGREPESIMASMAKSALRAAGTQIGREVIRGVLGSILGGRRR
jgi:hypothetical protein